MQIKSFTRNNLGIATAAALGALVAGSGIGLVGSYAQAGAEPLRLEEPVRMPSFADVVERVSPAVVSVRVTIEPEQAERSETRRGPRGGPGQQFGMPDIDPDHPLYEFFRRFEEFGFGPGPRGGEPAPQRPPRRAASQGSGFFISGDGYVVTNDHVVRNATTVEVMLDDGSSFEAEVVGNDPRTDLALLKIDAPEQDFPYLNLADERSRIGDWVVAIGNPFGLGGSVTAGIISGEARDIGAGPYDEFLQIDAPINRGNSGGPTFNLAGEVVGVNTAIFSPSGGNIGIAFAIPAHVTSNVVTALMEQGEVVRGYLGVQIQPVTQEIAEAMGRDDTQGALVAQPQPDSPADEAGLESGDIILSVDGESIADHRALSRRIADIDPGTAITLEIVRRGDVREISVEIGRLSDA
ncbi:MAG: putative trypsin-like serine protease [Saliniramus fredricksonii]|uniref:Probable periplasmic serine endoprotease DegP-like n=1 Tax=Saliniramus fredricksonii TaxID=1653334 RepID=A0A0P7Y5R4_9HYPH|nr:trypsin-like peptidase domain-containing protein [Saliniramus fredricksonii]KPQ12619.1 MAG: putative trypsin-like serine protease [Saliniramus fredricksonii]SCC82706.1 serine protease Do [Saliniramus fredricksonii]